MAHRNEHGFGIISRLPWPMGIVAGILGYAAIRYGIGWYFASSSGSNLPGFGQQASSEIDVALPWIVLIACWAAAAGSFFKRRRSRQLETQTSLDSSKQASSSTGDVKPTSAMESATTPSCPTCNAAMFKRFSRQTNQMFLGCTNYPRCKGTKPV